MVVVPVPEIILTELKIEMSAVAKTFLTAVAIVRQHWRWRAASTTMMASSFDGIDGDGCQQCRQY